MAGPPFSVPESEIRTLFNGIMTTDLIKKKTAEPLPARFANRGLTSLHQLTFIIRRHN
ncbi:MAG: hypothetical protein LC662_10140 [Rhodothermaceae bacterium]|nr:hypothetical protein [Rhodothermaceae bacterium]